MAKQHKNYSHPLYNRYRAMFDRCYNKKSPRFKDYGARNISVCIEWLDFKTFVADMGDCPKGMEIDRIDNNGNYCKENCRWVTRSANCSNRRTSNIFSYQGHNLCLKEIVLKYSTISYKTVFARIGYGWSLADALNKPVGNNTGMRWKNKVSI
jgi:hypothetical protein